MMWLVASLFIVAQAAPPAGWKTCGGLPDAYNNTACPTTQSCAFQLWAPEAGNWGCCPFPEGVSCSNFTCCPKGTKCVNDVTTWGNNWSTISYCVAPGDVEPVGCPGGEVAWFPHVIGSGGSSVGDQVCKTGPGVPYSTTLKNVLLIGDSVTNGYQPHVAEIMKHSALVQLSPWENDDGGAEETQYGARCIDNFVRAPDGTLLSPDVLMFNWGLHNSLAGYCTPPCVPGQLGPPADYAPYLEKIVTYLKAAPALQKTKLLFAITSPDLCDSGIDDIQRDLNKQAAAIMAKHGIPTVDLYKAITAKCGPVPQAECFGVQGCFCPHCEAGYSWLANSTIVPALTKLLE